MRGELVDVRRWADLAWGSHDWSTSALRHGAFHEVLVLPQGPVARIASGPHHEHRTAREVRAMTALAGLDLPVAVPSPLSAPITRAGRTGVLTSLVPGEPRDQVTWADLAGACTRVLAALATVDAARVAGALPPARQWCGGPTWRDLVEDRLVPLLPPRERTVARRVVTDLLHVEQLAQPSLVHGDLGPHNMLWSGPALTGLIDTDHAAWADPAIDVAPLLGLFGSQQLGRDVPPDVIDRAMYHRATLPLQVAAAAELVGQTPLRDHALGNFARRVDDGSLYEPGGSRPALEPPRSSGRSSL